MIPLASILSVNGLRKIHILSSEEYLLLQKKMTAEIAIINRGGIALAADSALTVGRKRVWKHSNKLFSLSPNCDIGIMFFGSGDYLGCPWDTVVKEFRKSTKCNSFKTVDECRLSFADFLKEKIFEHKEHEILSVDIFGVSLMEKIAKRLKYKASLDFRKKLVKEIDALIANRADLGEVILDISFDEFSKYFSKRIGELAGSVFEKKITLIVRDKLTELVWEYFRRGGFESGYETGIVFAGFGANEIYPRVQATVLDGKFKQHLRFWLDDDIDLNADKNSRGTIIPFGQGDISHLFMEGIGHDQLIYIQRALNRILNGKSDELVNAYVQDASEKTVEKALQKKENRDILKQLMEDFESYRRKTLVQPIMSVVSTLPKEEMAAMAESLVDLTGLRRKVDSALESVSAPIDVAIISKGDGFVWIKRKHYFNMDINMDYADRKLKHQGEA